MSGCKVADGIGTMLVKAQFYILFSFKHDHDDSELFL
jgi:hypothetical protein